jgi:histidinol-phosphate aminotransferase
MELKEYPNLVVMQTFSKAWGLAALRLGILFASEEIVGILNKIKPPYNINQATQELAMQALDHLQDVNEMIKTTIPGKGRIRK